MQRWKYPRLPRVSLFAGAFLLAFPAYGEPFADWDRTDSMLLGSALTLTAIDWGQTRDIAQHPERFSESNPILGAHPSVGRVDNYFLISMAGIVGLSAVLPSRTRKYVLGGVTFVEAVVVINNHGAGIRVSF